MVFSQWLKWSASQLSNVENPRMEAETLLMHEMQITKAQCITQSERVLPEGKEEKLNLLLASRKSGEPMAYILGQKPFWKFTLKVTPDVLIPRPETEILVEQVLETYSSPDLTVLDLGTGSGAIALALGLERPSWKMTAIDYSVAALRVAEENAHHLKVYNIKFIQSDWFSNLDNQKFDIIVSNPPYIAEQDPEWHEESKRYEPRIALVGGGVDGLDKIKTIISSAVQYLNPTGALFLEHGYDQAPKVQILLEKDGYHSISTVQDLSGCDRMTIGKRGGNVC